MLVLWIISCVLFAILFSKRIQIQILTSISIWILMPATAGVILTGVPLIGSSLPSIHPATYLIVVCFIIQALLGHISLSQVKISFILIHTLFVLIASVVSLLGGEGQSLGLIADTLIPGFCIFWLSRTAIRKSDTFKTNFTRTLITLAIVESFLSILQFYSHSTLIYSSYFSRYQYWYHAEYIERANGTLDHPLVHGTLLAATIPLCASLSRKMARYLATTLLLFGILASGSRASLILGIVVSIYSLRYESKKLLSGSLIAVTGGLFLYFSANFSLLQSSLVRFATDGGSSDYRVMALKKYGEIMWQYTFIGGGLGKSGEVTFSQGIGSLENGYLIWAIDIGLLATAVLFFWQIHESVARKGHKDAFGLSALVIILQSCTFSSFATRSVILVLLYSMLGMRNADKSQIVT